MTIQLAATEYGATTPADRPPIAILHGLFGSGRNWATVAQRIGERRRVIAFDLRNHGTSPWADSMNYAEMAEDVRIALNTRGHRRYALIGHSMGGKAAMIVTLTNPDEVARLIVVDIAPVPYGARHLGLVRAMQTLDLAAITHRSEADRALANAIPDAAERGFLLQNLVFENGRSRWRLNLAAIERNMPALVDFPAIPPGTIYPGPALFVAGSRSDYVRAEYETATLHLFPAAEIVRIEGAGHWLHAEKPAEFLAIAEPFLAAAAI
jgi:pimeloyl-ACP methyl ester carboxylesterase